MHGPAVTPLGKRNVRSIAPSVSVTAAADGAGLRESMLEMGDGRRTVRLGSSRQRPPMPLGRRASPHEPEVCVAPLKCAQSRRTRWIAHEPRGRAGAHVHTHSTASQEEMEAHTAAAQEALRRIAEAPTWSALPAGQCARRRWRRDGMGREGGEDDEERGAGWE